MFFHHHIIGQKTLARREIYLVNSLRSFALSLVGLFIPVYLLNVGFSLFYVLFFLVVSSLTVVLSGVGVAYLSANIGFKRTIMISSIFSVLELVGLVFIEPFMLIPLAVLDGLSVVFFWTPLSAMFAVASDPKKEAEQTSYLLILPSLLSSAAPFIGGVIITLLGFDLLYMIAVLILIAGTSIMFIGKDYKERQPKLKFVWSRKTVRFAPYFFLQGIMFRSLSVLVPLYFYLMVLNYEDLGSLGTLMSVGGVLFSYIVGKLSDRLGYAKVVKVGAVVIAGLWFLLTIASASIDVALVSSLLSTVFVMNSIPVFAVVSKHPGKHPAEFMAFRSMMINLGKLTAVLYLVFTGNFRHLFILSAIVSLLFLAFKE
ncbi:hypothetical protein DRN75_00650 [Nanoarchaeota archaeon]|nr:MAG: hypothetical protein DRN75_00650 [Nanoarchaeota archaeon]